MDDMILPYPKPCPFCSGRGSLHAVHYVDGTHQWWVSCRECGAMTQVLADGYAAIEAWNRRDGVERCNT